MIPLSKGGRPHGCPLVLFLAVLAAAIAPARAQVVYASHFANGAGPEWSSPKIEAAPSGHAFLGQFGNESVRLALPSLPPHTYVSLSFDVFAIQNWNGNGSTLPATVFTVSLPGGPALYRTSFSNLSTRQSYPEAYPAGDYGPRTARTGVGALGYPAPGDTTYHITLTFPHQEGGAALDFTAKGLPDAAGWGLDNVQVALLSTDDDSVLVNGDFENPPTPNTVTYTAGTAQDGFQGWKVSSGSVRLYSDGPNVASGMKAIELSSLGGGAIQQDVPVIPGQQYDVRFAMSGNPAAAPVLKNAQVYWGATLVGTASWDSTGRDLQNPGWEWRHFLVTAPAGATSVTLKFQAEHEGTAGPTIDAVSVSPVVPGDLNDDGRLDVADVAGAVRMLAGLGSRDPLERARADMAPWVGAGGRIHGEGLVTMADVNAILHAIMGQSAYPDVATSAVNDLLGHFWTGDATTGHIVPTWGGFPTGGTGQLWERAQVMHPLANLYQMTKSYTLRQRIASDWRWMAANFGTGALSGVGAGSANGWSDDAAWSTLMYLDVYRVTADPAALTAATNLFNNAYARWTDNTWGGGLWYTDDHKVKSVYQAALILAGLRLYDITGDVTIKNRAMSLYNWVESHLARGRGLYYVDFNGSPLKNNAPPLQGSSDTFLAGNMAMGIIQARLYRATNDSAYLAKALQTADAVLAVENDGLGRLLDDRDANTNGFFLSDWVADVLSLPGIGPEHAEALRRTANAVYYRDRTPDGYYGGDWSGPALGPTAVWPHLSTPFVPQESVVSANAVDVIVAAAGLGVLQPDPARAF